MDNDYPSLQSLVLLARDMGRERWRVVSDVAQVVANYLRCHPKVEAIRYPGLKSDVLFEEASRTLVAGFGPVVLYKAMGEWHELVCESFDAKETVMVLERSLAISL